MPIPAELRGLDGDVFDDEATLAGAAQDWGHVVQAWPSLVAMAGSARDVATVLGYATDRQIPVAARGAGHSPFGQSQARGGIVLDLTGLSAVRSLGDDRISVGAGARWSAVLAETLPRGLTPPVLTDYLELTVGGTLVLGGIGGATHHHGTQTDTVDELEVVTGAGEVVTCSRKENRPLFDAMLAGLGQCGVITEATVRLVPARELARHRQLFYDTFGDFLADQRRVVRDGRFDYLEGQLVLDDFGRWRYLLEATTYFSPGAEPDDTALLGDLGFDRDTAEVVDTSYLEFLDRMREGEEFLRAEGSWFSPHPWLNLFVPDDAVESLVSDSVANLDRPDIGATGLVMLYPVRADRLRTPLLRVPPGELVWLYAVLRTGNPYDPVLTGELVEQNIALYQRVRDAGGTVYPTNVLPLSTSDWEAHFGPAWTDLAAAKRRFDPATILAPGQGLFH